MIEPAESSEAFARLPIVAISGPTAAGKSSLAMALCQALPQGGEVVSVDSAQIYRGMDIGSAKPDLQAQALVRHHLIDILDPAEPYSAARFAADAAAVIADIRHRGRIPVLVGGTLLYHRALFEGLNDLPPADAALRLELETERLRIGVDAQHARLAEVDPMTAARLHPNDSQRVQRALEIHALSGRPASAWHAEPNAGAGVPGTVLRFAVMPPAKALFDARIAVRFRQMIDAGLVDEVARLRARGDLHLDLPSIRAVGYRQIWRHLDGDFGLVEACRLAVIATRQFAKRQMTWLRSDRSWTWLDAAEPAALAEVLNVVESSQTLEKQ